jgi:streptogramin lyase
MRKGRPPLILISLMLSFSGLLLLMMSAAGASEPVAKAGGSTTQETWLDFTGTAYEINPDTQGNLWISDDGANQIWQVNPASGVYTIYPGMANASDARMDPAGVVWWTNAGNTDLGRISLGTSTVTTWTLPGAGTLWGITFDNAGHVWSTDFAEGKLYRFTPSTTEVCTYPVPDAGVSDYIVADGGDLWLADWSNDRILRLQPAAGVFTRWQLMGDAYPQGLALQANGNLWWADEDLQMLARLEPGSDRLTAYTLPAGTTPEMIALSGGKVWYTESMSGTVGVLDPTSASGATSALVRTTTPVTPVCTNLGAGTSANVTISTRTIEWTPAVYTRTVNSGGWTVYELPTGALPWGIAAGNGDVWVVDQGRRKLAHLLTSVTRYFYLPLIIR